MQGLKSFTSVLLLFLHIGITPVCLKASDPDSLYLVANQHFLAQEWNQALALYDSVLSPGSLIAPKLKEKVEFRRALTHATQLQHQGKWAESNAAFQLLLISYPENAELLRHKHLAFEAALKVKAGMRWGRTLTQEARWAEAYLHYCELQTYANEYIPIALALDSLSIEHLRPEADSLAQINSLEAQAAYYQLYLAIQQIQRLEFRDDRQSQHYEVGSLLIQHSLEILNTPSYGLGDSLFTHFAFDLSKSAPFYNKKQEVLQLAQKIAAYYEQQASWDKALLYYTEALLENRHAPAVRERLVDCYEVLAAQITHVDSSPPLPQWLEIRLLYEAMVDLVPDDPRVQKLYALVLTQIGELFMKAEQWLNAHSVYWDLLEIHNSDVQAKHRAADALFKMAQAHLDYQRWGQAISSFTRILKSQPDHHNALVGLAKALREAQQMPLPGLSVPLYLKLAHEQAKFSEGLSQVADSILCRQTPRPCFCPSLSPKSTKANKPVYLTHDQKKKRALAQRPIFLALEGMYHAYTFAYQYGLSPAQAESESENFWRGCRQLLYHYQQQLEWSKFNELASVLAQRYEASEDRAQQLTLKALKKCVKENEKKLARVKR